MDTFTVSFEYKKHDGSTMHFATNIDQPTFGSLLKNKVFDEVPSLNMFKNQVETDIRGFAEPKKKTIALFSNTDGGNHSAKKRGRPPKSKDDKEEVAAAVPKKRGRPPKNVQQQPEEVKVPKKRGRPPKNALFKQLTLQNSLKKTPEKTPESSPETGSKV